MEVVCRQQFQQHDIHNHILSYQNELLSQMCCSPYIQDCNNLYGLQAVSNPKLLSKEHHDSETYTLITCPVDVVLHLL